VQLVYPHEYHGHGHVDTAEPTCEPSITEVDVESIFSFSSEESVTQDDFEESSTASDESSEDDEPDKRTVLKAGKPPQDQIKLIIFEQAILYVFGKCGQCGSDSVSTENQIGSSCKICSSCTAQNEYYFEWTIGP
jgi:formylmethanofuran dehydrogenase subunit E